MAAPRANGIPISTVNPHYLHTNSTSHKWSFSAIAELIDNGFDVKAKQFWIDKQIVKGQIRLVFMDNGAGMDFNEMHKMLSFGFNDKQRFRNHVPVGRYGNGFKSSSMRLGRDAIVFSRKADTMCVGLLSQTYLEDIKAENVIVPIISFTPTGQTFDVAPEHEASLQDILKYSQFNTKGELLTELRLIDEKSPQSTGTRIIIWNLRLTNSVLELDFSQDLDIRIPDDAYESTIEQMRWQGLSVPESEYSLRAYCSILYLIPKMQIIIRGEKVKTLELSKSLAHIYKDRYKPKFLNHSTEITFGYDTKNTDHYGIMMYHNNRLIKAYEPVACQRKADSTGVGAIGIIECNYLEPTHNKQDFMPTDEYRKTMQTLNTKLKEYCGTLQTNSAVPVKDSVSCDAEQEPQDSEEANESRQHLSGVTKRQQHPSSSDSISQTGPAVKSPARNKRAQNQDNKTADTSASEACSSKTRNIPHSDDCEAGLQVDDNNSVSSEKSLDQDLQDKEEMNQLQHEQDQLKEKHPSSSDSILQTGPAVKSPARNKRARNQDNTETKKPRFDSRTEDTSASVTCSSKTRNIPDSGLQLDDNNSVSSEKSQDHELLFQQDKEETNQLQHEREQLKEKVSNQEDDSCMLSSESVESDLYENANLNEGQENNNLHAYRTTLNELGEHVAQVLSKFVPPLNHQKVNNVCQDIDKIFRGVIDEISKAAST